MNTISVIVPVYNVHNYLKRTIDSILCQTHTSIELIMADDGSTDDSATHCDERAMSDMRVIVIHDENSGPSRARNSGVQLSNGRYIGFVDSDDYIEPSMYETMLSQIVDDVDMVICSIKIVDTRGNVIEDVDLGTKKLDSIQALEMLQLQHGAFYTTVWNRIYKSKIMKKITFPEGMIYEDAMVAHECISSCRQIQTISDKLYYYTRRLGSIIKSPITIERINVVDALSYRSEFYLANNYKKLLYLNAQRLRQEFDWVYFQISPCSTEEMHRMGRARRKFLKYGLRYYKGEIKPCYLIRYFCPSVIFYTAKRVIHYFNK